jgi:DNA-binding response OmpR family regulator
VSRVVVYEASQTGGESCAEALGHEEVDLVTLTDGEALLEEVVQHPPDVVVYGLHPECQQDLAVLHLLRRAMPTVPLVLVAAESSLDTRKLVQSLRAIYYAVRPVDPAELRDAVHAALAQRHRQTA